MLDEAALALRRALDPREATVHSPQIFRVGQMLVLDSVSHGPHPQERMGASAPILVLDRPITPEELASLLGRPFEGMVKFVVDLRLKRVAFGGELHVDAEELLLERGSAQADLWGGNYFPGHGDAECVEYSSMINTRVADGNAGMEVQKPELRARIRALVLQRVGRAEKLQP